jgi:hypothetical protein
MMRTRRAQSLGEYTVITSLVVLAIMAMTYFIQRGFAARINDARGYMLTTLDQDIREIHERRGGQAYKGVRAEYEPYYTNKITDMATNPRIQVLINGPADTYIYDSRALTNMNSVSRELPAEDQ